MKKNLLLLITLFILILSSCTTPQTSEKYIVTFTDSDGTVLEEGEVIKGTCVVKIEDPVKEGFVFLYWVNQKTDEIFDFATPIEENIILKAKWEQSTFHTHTYTEEVVESTCTEEGYTMYTCACGDIFTSNYKEALDHDLVYHEKKDPTSTEIGWNEYYTCNRCDYNTYHELPKLDNTPVELEVYEENGYQYVNYGKYPQTHISDETLINELNKLIQTNSQGYYEYNGEEYYKITTSIFCYTYDLGLEQEDFNSMTYSDGTKIEDNTIEWFKVEPIKWRILSINNSYQVFSEYILDASCCYHDSSEIRTIDGNTIYPNNYKYSDIRNFLNNDFLNKAFTINQQNTLLTTEVDNSSSTTDIYSNEYACENTYDKIYLLSYQDIINLNYGFGDYYKEDILRQAKVTDYAKAVGVCWVWDSPYWGGFEQYFGNGSWWLRSPSCDNYCYAHCIDCDGYATSDRFIEYSLYGVRPATVIAVN